MKRRRPNYWENRYNQHVIAGKIAIATKAINPYTSADEVDRYTGLMRANYITVLLVKITCVYLVLMLRNCKGG